MLNIKFKTILRTSWILYNYSKNKHHVRNFSYKCILASSSKYLKFAERMAGHEMFWMKQCFLSQILVKISLNFSLLFFFFVCFFFVFFLKKIIIQLFFGNIWKEILREYFCTLRIKTEIWLNLWIKWPNSIHRVDVLFTCWGTL